MVIFIWNLIQYHFWISILKIIDLTGKRNFVVITDTEFQDIWKITGLMEKDPWVDKTKDEMRQ